MLNECEKRNAERLRYRGMYNQERGADVEFEVGFEGQTWRLTAHSHVVAKSSPVLKSMLSGAFQRDKSTPLPIRDTEPRAFESLLRYCYGHAPEFKNVSTALSTFHVAHMYLCPGLEWEVAAFLNEHVQTRPECALEVFLAAGFYCETNEIFEPSAPPAYELVMSGESESSSLINGPHTLSDEQVGTSDGSTPDCKMFMGEASRRLRHNCLQTMDQFANEILALEQFEDLDLESLLAVISRDTFAVSSELALLNAVERWAECECRRQKLSHTAENLQDVVGGSGVICSGRVARLLLLSTQEFAEGPMGSPLLNDAEQKLFLLYLLGNGGADQEELDTLGYINWAQLSRSREASTPQYLPIATQQYPGRCAIRPCKSRKPKGCWRWFSRKQPDRNNKKQHQHQQQPASLRKKDEQIGKSEKPLCYSKTCDCMLTVIACLFD
ncbi:BTB/POZ domain-containing protein 3-like isoform X2 [Cloeon dipterum]|uniref:BTB/POZ domain-containing protein 3-like isoform X2 n=1 Tax=Cloeon dipterum TaxID=197152 RepID=UPI0032205D67